MPIKIKILKIYKNKKNYLFQIKIGTRNKKSGQIRTNPKHFRKSKKILKIYQFLIDFHSGGSSVPLGTIINSSRTNPRFGPSFK